MSNITGVVQMSIFISPNTRVTSAWSAAPLEGNQTWLKLSLSRHFYDGELATTVLLSEDQETDATISLCISELQDIISTAIR